MRNNVTLALIACGLAAAQGSFAAPAEIDFAEVEPIGHNVPTAFRPRALR